MGSYSNQAAQLKYHFLHILPLLFSLSVHAFDNNRQGFCLGIDMGAGLQLNLTQMIVEGHTYTGKMRADFAVPTDFKIGFSKTGKTAFFLSTHNDWKKPGVSVLSVNSALIEIDHFYESAAPSFFISYGTGWAYWLYPLDSYFNDHFAGNGFSCFLGYGYEYNRHFTVKIETFLNALMHKETIINATMDYSGKVLYSEPADYRQWYYVASVRMTVGYLFY
jgi:hypothetical protein